MPKLTRKYFNRLHALMLELVDYREGVEMGLSRQEVYRQWSLAELRGFRVLLIKEKSEYHAGVARILWEIIQERLDADQDVAY